MHYIENLVLKAGPYYDYKYNPDILSMDKPMWAKPTYGKPSYGPQDPKTKHNSPKFRKTKFGTLKKRRVSKSR
jgi:hypothetical protein